ncbi:PTS mannose transporter subunit IIAB [Actinobacillus pleuropneumoniae]|uniref:PTS system mannose-specific EIIAB component n=1 Tax=Actinobacillus pleuropneumoniae serotype 5b (strain L20) TaxID=416269 RepID=A3N239_ACTP2|nr:PTS mannose transporter subunit IIAB [Actinobacillus pleuropneumoniae]ABN74475.1 PTS system mannose-specific EIIAB component [Actinobacillus pleuropneumoniae serovar 5b str. L20]MEE3683837.1 PTS mannose transporter subunit IIAB [Actinobacillus pleuropneumoniae]QSZ39442.1 PTS mannose transporter subunit IIAB [Actinobacillus pleuropneumoniae]UKH09736.1 PTS mannose transporter subunit IIAB [Actinobacillus pleuropneumoniae]UKH20521.1 PTS mannose transporter subunit IIAB [Actinobacillus pleuropn
MSIAIIIATHGVAAEQLLKTTEMLIGEQSDVAYIDFVPGENAETIMGKYQAKLANELAHCDEVLFLVDTWGGSPFNAANRTIDGKQNMNIVTGVNVPMLVETFMARDDDPSLDELVEIALEAGRLGVRALKEQEQTAVEPEVKPAPVAQPTTVQNNGVGHLTIGLARIDDRLIHGQVATRWTKESRVTRIVVVNDDVAKDTVRSTMLKSVAPPGVTAHVVPVDKMIRVYNNPEYAGERMMLLFTNPTDVVRLSDAGVTFESINIGGMAYKDGKKMITSAVAVDDQDIDAFKTLDAKGIELDVRKVSNDARQYMMDLLKKNSLI